MKSNILAAITGIMVFLLGVLCAAAENPSEKIFKRVSALTILAKGDSKNGLIAESGFVYKRTGDTVYIVTKADLFTDSDTVELTFFSGTSKEKSMRGKLFCCSKIYNLAVVKVSAPFLKTPLLETSEVKLYQTMPLYVVGFTFGEKKSGAPENQETSIETAAISGFHKNEDGSLKFIRLDANVTLGNMGAPVIDEKGKFIGMFWGGLSGTKIAEVLPASFIEKIFGGYVENLKAGRLFKENDIFKVEIQARIFDPFNTIKDVSVVAVPISDLTAEQRRAGSFSDKPIARMDKFSTIKIKDCNAQGIVSLGKIKKQIATFAIQLRYTGHNDQIKYLPLMFYHFHKNNAVSPEPQNSYSPETEESNLFRDVSDKSDLPKPVTVNQSISGDKAAIADAEIIRLKLESKLASLFWNRDKKSFYALDQEGVLRKISFPECKEETRLDLKQKTSSGGLSKDGIVIMLPGRNELWLIDEATLAVKKRIKMNNGLKVVCSPSLEIAFVTDKGSPPRSLFIIDLKKGKLVRKIDTSSLPPGNFTIEFNNYDVSEDGKFLFLSSHSAFYIFRIVERYGLGHTISMLEKVPRDLGNGKIVLSGDNRYFALPQAGKIFSVKNLNDPVMKIKTGKNLVFAKDNRRIFSTGPAYDLSIYDIETGKNLKDYNFADIDTRKNNIIIEKMLADSERNILIASSGMLLYKIKLLKVAAMPAEKEIYTK